MAATEKFSSMNPNAELKLGKIKVKADIAMRDHMKWCTNKDRFLSNDVPLFLCLLQVCGIIRE
jgi:hypothetical protein